MSDPASLKEAPVGRIVGAFGIHGEAKVKAVDPSQLRSGLQVTATPLRGDARALVIASLRPHQRLLLVSFDGISDPESIDALRGAVLTASLTDVPPLPAGTYHDRELVGMAVIDERLGALGEVVEVRHYPQADMLVVGDRAVLVPMLQAYGVRVDCVARTVATMLPEGFEDLL